MSLLSRGFPNPQFKWKIRKIVSSLSLKLIYLANPRIPNAAFNVGSKTLECQKKRRTVMDFTSVNDHQTGGSHLFRNRKGCMRTNNSTGFFESNLRDYPAFKKHKNNLLREKHFETIPHKDRKEFPIFLKPYRDEKKGWKELKRVGRVTNRKLRKRNFQKNLYDTAL